MVFINSSSNKALLVAVFVNNQDAVLLIMTLKLYTQGVQEVIFHIIGYNKEKLLGARNLVLKMYKNSRCLFVFVIISELFLKLIVKISFLNVHFRAVSYKI